MAEQSFSPGSDQERSDPGEGVDSEVPTRRRPTLDGASAAIRGAVRESLRRIHGPVAAPTGGPVPSIILAISGGTDSMALLHAVAFLHRRGEVLAHAVTVDHGLQEASAEVADRVHGIAESWGVPAEVRPVAVRLGAEGVEAAARAARYSALEEAREAHNAAWIFTAHTRSDQAETVLLGLLRGSGTRSLAGMAERTGRVVRPLLGLDRAHTEAAVDAQGIEVWDDPMNVDPVFARVRARSMVERLEAELGQPITANLARTAALCRADADHLESLSAEAGHRLHGCTDIAVGEVDRLPDAVLRRVLRAWLLSLGVSSQAIGAERILELVDLVRGRRGLKAENGRGGRLSLPGGTEVVLRAGRLNFGPVGWSG